MELYFPGGSGCRKSLVHFYKATNLKKDKISWTDSTSANKRSIECNTSGTLRIKELFLWYSMSDVHGPGGTGLWQFMLGDPGIHLNLPKGTLWNPEPTGTALSAMS